MGYYVIVSHKQTKGKYVQYITLYRHCILIEWLWSIHSSNNNGTTLRS